MAALALLKNLTLKTTLFVSCIFCYKISLSSTCSMIMLQFIFYESMCFDFPIDIKNKKDRKVHIVTLKDYRKMWWMNRWVNVDNFLQKSSNCPKRMPQHWGQVRHCFPFLTAKQMKLSICNVHTLSIWLILIKYM